MTYRRSTLRWISRVLLSTATMFALVGCGDHKQTPPAIVVAFSTSFPPPAALATNATAGIAAVVTNDSSNAGVTFTCLPAGGCGTFTPTSIASDVPATYQAPGVVPQGNAVTVTATSVTDSTKFISATITIN